MFNTRQATLADIPLLSPRLLPISFKEFRGAGFPSPEDYFTFVLPRSQNPTAILCGDDVVGIFGTMEGQFWGCLGDGVKPIFLSLVKYSKKYLQSILPLYGEIGGAVHKDNTYIIKWASLLGFTISPPFPLGNTGEYYVSFKICVSP